MRGLIGPIVFCVQTIGAMDLEENYDPDCDVSRFLAFPDPPLEMLVLSPCADEQSLQTPAQHMLDANARQSLSLVASGINSVSPVPSMPLPLSVEGVIILAMEGVNAEPTCEPIFEQYLPGQKDCTGCVTLREVTHCSGASEMKN